MSIVSTLFSSAPFHGQMRRLFSGIGVKWKSANVAMAESLQSGSAIFLHGNGAEPVELMSATVDYVNQADLKNLSVAHLYLAQKPVWRDSDPQGRVRSRCLFVPPSLRQAVADGKADAVSILLSQIHRLFETKKVPVDVAFIQVTPDKFGFYSMGIGVDVSKAAVRAAKKVVALVNPRMPRTFGDSLIHQSLIDTFVEATPSAAIGTLPLAKPSEAEEKIGQIIAERLIDDGATLQLGIGSIPDSVLNHLQGHKHLGIHTEMLSDGVMSLTDKGVVDNSLKTLVAGRTICTFILGTQRLYDFVNDNPGIIVREAQWVNDPFVIAQNRQMTAINQCVEVDLSGQISSDSVGSRIISGFGGQLDFMFGSGLGRDGRGRPIVATTSTTRRGESKIVARLRQGGGVVTPRALVHYVVTEYGIADLFGKDMGQRAKELIKVAHPDHRENLERAASEWLK